MGTTLGTAPTQVSQRKGNSKKRSHSMSVETFDARGLLLGNRYYMMAQIGKGTFAEVYSARDLFTDKTVAIKFQSHDIRGNLSGLFNREASILNRFKSCPRVPALYKHCDLKWTQGDEGTTPSIIQREALIMEMCQGEDMAHLRNATRKRYKKLVSAVQGSPEIPLPVAAYMVCEMVACLKPLHEIGVVHRDVKPSNFVRATSTGTSFKVLDFGLARMWRDDGGKVVSPREDVGFRGTSNYASVVALRGQEQGPRDDLWSVLYVFIDMVANELPWSGVSRARSSKDLSGGLVGLKESHSGNPADKEDKLLEWIQSKVEKARAHTHTPFPSHNTLTALLHSMSTFPRTRRFRELHARSYGLWRTWQATCLRSLMPISPTTTALLDSSLHSCTMRTCRTPHMHQKDFRGAVGWTICRQPQSPHTSPPLCAAPNVS